MDEDRFGRMNRPLQVGTQRTSALRFADPVVQGVFGVLVLFSLLPRGFTNREFRERLAPLLGLPLSAMTPGRTSYQLRRLRLHGLIERQPRSNRYRVTQGGLRTALFWTRTYNRLLRPGYHSISPESLPVESPLLRHFNILEDLLDQRVATAKLVA